ncbi:hypothetical protein [Bradyrhizobium japonicum]|uniref:hypothetical protein n=1 Tax=Bradyrhizobium japonicum TaxID=375 RepID=UPI000577C29F|nr:hypothetical protein [Bradyrhizobium japonicum]
MRPIIDASKKYIDQTIRDLPANAPRPWRHIEAYATGLSTVGALGADQAQDRRHVEIARTADQLSKIYLQSQDAKSAAVTAVPADGMDAASLKETASSVCVAIL